MFRSVIECVEYIDEIDDIIDKIEKEVSNSYKDLANGSDYIKYMASEKIDRLRYKAESFLLKKKDAIDWYNGA